LFFLENYELDQDFELFFDFLKLTFQSMPHLSVIGLFRMVFEHLQRCFHPEDSMSEFPQLFQLCFHIAKGHIAPQIAHVLSTVCLLTMNKPLGGICPIIVGETLY
jgi:hypothetical protein